MNILLFAFEGESIPIGALARDFKQAGHKVFIFNVDHWNIKYTKGEIFQFYQEECGLSKDEFGHLSKFYELINQYTDVTQSEEVDWFKLREFEIEFLPSGITLSRIFATDTLFYRVFHHRDIYYLPPNKNIYYKAIELLTAEVVELFKRIDPELVFSIQNQYALKFLTFQMCQRKKIPYINLFVSRILKKWIFSTSFHVGTCPLIKQNILDRMEVKTSTLEADHYIELIQQTLRSAYTSHEIILRGLKSDYQLFYRIRKSFRVAIYFGTLYAKGVVRSYRNWFQQDYFEPGLLGILRLEVRGIFRMIQYRNNALLNRKALPNTPFVYFTMHLMPESSTSTMADTLNELECIYQLSLILPVDWKIVVKINPTMIADVDTHPNEYYNRINRIPAVWFMDPLYPSLDIIRQSEATASLAGTSLLEGVLMGRPGICWGNPEFNCIDGIYHFSDGNIVENIRKKTNMTIARYYIQYCLDEGVDIDFSELTSYTAEFKGEAYNKLIKILSNRILTKANEYNRAKNLS